MFPWIAYVTWGIITITIKNARHAKQNASPALTGLNVILVSRIESWIHVCVKMDILRMLHLCAFNVTTHVKLAPTKQIIVLHVHLIES